LEYGKLSEQSGNVIYIENVTPSSISIDLQATRAWWPIVQPKEPSLLPGMSGQPVSVWEGNSTAEYEWGGGEDSYYEVDESESSADCST
jgi:hypothetical protein